MSRDDVRVQWLRDRVLAALRLTDPAPFEELLQRGHGEGARAVLRFLERGAPDGDREGEADTALLLLRAERRGEDGEKAAGEPPWAPPTPFPAPCFPLSHLLSLCPVTPVLTPFPASPSPVLCPVLLNRFYPTHFHDLSPLWLCPGGICAIPTANGY